MYLFVLGWVFFLVFFEGEVSFLRNVLSRHLTKATGSLGGTDAAVFVSRSLKTTGNKENQVILGKKIT